jgi:hypothetical protein
MISAAEKSSATLNIQNAVSWPVKLRYRPISIHPRRKNGGSRSLPPNFPGVQNASWKAVFSPYPGHDKSLFGTALLLYARNEAQICGVHVSS